MRPLSVPEIEQKRDDVFLYRSLLKIRDGLNAALSSLAVGTATLSGGSVNVHFLGLTADSVIIPVYQRPSGTPGHLYVDPMLYNLPAKTFTIKSTSSSDNSVVAWLHWV